MAAILKVEDLSIGFANDEGVTAITDRVNFELRRGEVLGLVGESGCGKTVTALSLLRLLPSPGGRVLAGRILFDPDGVGAKPATDILAMSQEELRDLRGDRIAMIFQEPSAALNPLMTIQQQLREVFDYHAYSGDPDVRIRELLRRVGFADPDRILSGYPHELSGGMLQRVVIAMALLLKPAVIIADEPTTALDVTVQAQIMELLVELQREEGTTVLLITHNLGLIAQYADRLAVMYAGRIVEEAPVEDFLAQPLHPYSRGLLAALPDLYGDRGKALQPIGGQVPRPKDYDDGCRFRERCPRAFEACTARPHLQTAERGEQGADQANIPGAGNRSVACFLYHDAEQTAAKH